MMQASFGVAEVGCRFDVVDARHARVDHALGSPMFRRGGVGGGCLVLPLATSFESD